jgi:hypothetical protein
VVAGDRADRRLLALVGFTVLRLDLSSIPAVGFLIGGMFVAGALDEMMQARATQGAKGTGSCHH